ncbi:MAG: hypothetical protein IKY10_00650, partial [Clostridia bacterium]|nr:hypothetical protein [Clostridia bacterium]
IKCYKTESKFDEFDLTENMISGFDTTSVGHKTMIIKYKDLNCEVDYKVLCRTTDVNGIMIIARNNFANSNKATIIENQIVSRNGEISSVMYESHTFHRNNSYIYRIQKDKDNNIISHDEVWFERDSANASDVRFYKQYDYDAGVLDSIYYSKDIFAYDGRTRAEEVYDGLHIGEETYGAAKVKNIELTSNNVLKISYEFVSSSYFNRQVCAIYEIKDGYLIKETYEMKDVSDNLVWNSEQIYSYNNNAQGEIAIRPTNVEWVED